MGKSKEPGFIQNRSIYSRMSYLYQAASYFATHPQQTEANSATKCSENNEAKIGEESKQSSHINQVLSRRFASDLRTTSQKIQIRMSSAMKQSICKYCDTLLIEGDTSTSLVENTSKGGKKPWADVLVVKCHTCQGVKRFPIQARQKRRPVRDKESNEKREKGLNEKGEKKGQDGDVVMGT